MKNLLPLCLTAAMIVLLAGCSRQNIKEPAGTTDTLEDKGLVPMGDHVTYNPNHLVNDGKPISIDWWIWSSEALFQNIADAYEEIHPNVTSLMKTAS